MSDPEVSILSEGTKKDLAEVTDSVRQLVEWAAESAVEALEQDTVRLKAFFKSNFTAQVAGVGFMSDAPALSILIHDAETMDHFATIDTIQCFFNDIPDPASEDGEDYYEHAIASLQAGIDRIKAYQASCAAAKVTNDSPM